MQQSFPYFWIGYSGGWKQLHTLYNQPVKHENNRVQQIWFGASNEVVYHALFLGHYTEKRPCFLGIAWNLKIIIFWLSSCKNDECHSFSWIIEHCKTKSHLAARFFFSTVFQSWGQVLFITMCGSVLSNEVRVMIATYIRNPLQHLVILKISPWPHFA